MLMYNAVIPDYDRSNDNGYAGNNNSHSDNVISLFDVGKRLMDGSGIK